VTLDDELVTQSQDKFRDLRVIDMETNEETPYELYGEPFRNKSLVSEVTDILIDNEEVSLDKYNIEKLKDGNKKSYMFIPDNDIYNDVSIILDTGEESHIDRIVIFTYDKFASWRSVSIEASDDKKEWKTIRSRIEDPHQTWRWYGFPRSTNYRYYKVNFETSTSLKLNEIILQTRNEATLQFVANEGSNYRVYYGDIRASITEYGEINYLENTPFTVVNLAKQKKNADFNRDIDRDSIDYNIDNCPFDKNSSQVDSDNDGIGDACQDEFVYSKESTDNIVNNDSESSDYNTEVSTTTPVLSTKVNDKDSDGISNIFDNCPNTYNPSQYDKDLNGIGDACDKNKNHSNYVQILVGILIFVCLIIILSMIKLTFSNKEDVTETVTKKEKTARRKTVKKTVAVKKPTSKKKLKNKN